MQAEKSNSATIVETLIERIGSTWQLTQATRQLAQAELKLAANSALLLIGLIALLVLVILCVWLTLLGLCIVLLYALGFSLAAAIATVLAAQLLLCAGLAVLARSLLQNMAFNQTRQAITQATTSPTSFQQENAT